MRRGGAGRKVIARLGAGEGRFLVAETVSLW